MFALGRDVGTVAEVSVQLGPVLLSIIQTRRLWSASKCTDIKSHLKTLVKSYMLTELDMKSLLLRLAYFDRAIGSLFCLGKFQFWENHLWFEHRMQTLSRTLLFVGWKIVKIYRIPLKLCPRPYVPVPRLGYTGSRAGYCEPRHPLYFRIIRTSHMARVFIAF